MLHLHRAERADVLVDALGDVLSAPLPDPLQAEVVSVPTRGVERWLTQRLAHRLGASAGGGRFDGVCGNVDFPFPGRLVGDAMGAACGVERDDDPWRPERSVWPLLDLLDECLDESWLATVAAHVRGDRTRAAVEPRQARRFGTARHVADLYDRYAVHRPEMVRAWAKGEHVDAAGERLAEASWWQAELWRRLRDRMGVDSPAERLHTACVSLAADPTIVDLPERLSIFGLTRLPASYVDVLRALAANRDVHLFLLHPSAALWDEVGGRLRVTGGTDANAGTAAPIRRPALDPTAGAAANPLLRSWGRDAREMQLVITQGEGDALDHHHPMTDAEPATLLQRIQHAVRHDVAPPGEPLPRAVDERAALDPADRSIQVHACHGRARQVEVLRDAVLHLLADDPTLEPRDVIVMCPDIETFAPLIHATFGAGEGIDDEADAASRDGDAGAPGDGAPAPAPALRVRLADRSLRQTNPVLGATSALLALADARVTSAEVLDFAGRDPVRRRFRFDDDDLARMKEWVSATAIRWGLDADHRAPFDLAGVGQNTWRAGLDRVLVGVTMADQDERVLNDVVPLDDAESGAIDLAGRFAELVDRLRAAVDDLRRPKTVNEWAAAIGKSARALMDVSERDAWQRAQLQRLLEELVAEATADDDTSDAELALSEVRALLADRLRGRPTRANFRTGHLTVCTLVPMRSVPHRVVCLLGLDDDAFPRKAERDGDDLVAADPFVGDVDGRSEDRQLLLDALLAATEHLVITYRGRDERTNAALPPAVPVGELLDVIDATARVEDGAGTRTTRVRDRIVVHHPLQPFDPRNFEAGVLRPEQPWSFDAVTLAGALALCGDRSARTSWLAGPLSAPPRSDVVELHNLVAFVKHPVRAFLRQRLGISLGDFTEELDETMPVDLDGLERWGVGERVLAARLAGASPEACEAAERARGELPPGELAKPAFDEIHENVARLVVAARAAAGDEGDAALDSVEISVPLDDGRTLVGTVAGIMGGVARTVTYSRLAAKHRLPAWVRFLALSACRAEEGFEVVTIGRGNGDKVSVSTFVPLAADPKEAEARALRHLADLVDLYDRGLREPLPIYCATSGAYAAAIAKRKDPLAAAEKEWKSEHFDKEDKDAEHRLILGGVVGLDALLDDPPREDEDGDGWDASDDTRFGRYARRLWTPVLAAERLESR